MKAVRVHKPGGPEAMVYEEVERPSPGPGQVLVRVLTAGVNYVDTYIRSGLYPRQYPLTLGVEMAG